MSARVSSSEAALQLRRKTWWGQWLMIIIHGTYIPHTNQKPHIWALGHIVQDVQDAKTQRRWGLEIRATDRYLNIPNASIFEICFSGISMVNYIASLHDAVFCVDKIITHVTFTGDVVSCDAQKTKRFYFVHSQKNTSPFGRLQRSSVASEENGRRGNVVNSEAASFSGCIRRSVATPSNNDKYNSPHAGLIALQGRS